MMNIEVLVVGPIETNCYIVSDPDSKEAVIIDAGDDADLILRYIENHGLKVKYLLNTHGHFDHMQANDAVRDKTGAPLGIHADDVELLLHPEKVSGGMFMQVNSCREPEKILHNGDILFFGACQLQVIYTPGHSRGGCCFMRQKKKFVLPGIPYSAGAWAVPIYTAATWQTCVNL